MQIITLQNPTFNMWAWILGTVIMLIIAGMGFEEEPENATILAIFSWAWPTLLVILTVFFVGYTPFWIGKKLRVWQEK
jgi:hypothetical protein